MQKKSFYEKYIKRMLDFFSALLLLLIFSPIFLILTLTIRIKLGGPVIFSQERPGKNETIFRLYKFRSMTNKCDENGNLLPDSDRLPIFGQKLRSTSLDELPELVNILKGDMSFVGPRPLLVKYLPLYNEHQARRHEVRPGLTGLAQVHGRNGLSWPERFDLDVEYVNNISFLGDCRILLQTVGVVLKREGISSNNSVTMEEFEGNEKEDMLYCDGLHDGPVLLKKDH